MVLQQASPVLLARPVQTFSSEASVQREARTGTFGDGITGFWYQVVTMNWNESGVNISRVGEVFRVEKGVCVCASVCWGVV